MIFQTVSRAVEGIAEEGASISRTILFAFVSTEGDCCSKGVFGSHKDVIAFWLSVKKYRNRRTGEIECRSEVLGSVQHVFEFEGMTDFQYLPTYEGEDIRDKIHYMKVDEDIQTFVGAPAENLYLVPQVTFSAM